LVENVGNKARKGALNPENEEKKRNWERTAKPSAASIVETPSSSIAAAPPWQHYFPQQPPPERPYLHAGSKTKLRKLRRPMLNSPNPKIESPNPNWNQKSLFGRNRDDDATSLIKLFATVVNSD